MDPDATLTLIRQALINDDPETACDLFQDLDNWISRGGFIPTDWVQPEIGRLQPAWESYGYGETEGV
jgi:hypothetical protein